MLLKKQRFFTAIGLLDPSKGDSMSNRDIVFSGVSALPVTRDGSAPIPDLCAQVAREALADAGVKPGDIDGLFVTPASISGENWMMFAANLGEFLGLTTKALATLENGGITSLLALRSACDAVALGRVKTALVIACDTRPHIDPTHFEAFVKGVTFQSLSLYGPNMGILGLGAPIPIYAMSAQRYKHEYGATDEDLAQVSVTLRQHASKHPIAQFSDPMTVDDVLTSKMISPPVRVTQCAGISTGAAAIVVTLAENAPDNGRPQVRLTGYGEHHHPSHFIPQHGSLTRFESVEEAAKTAFEEAGRTPAEVDVAEVYGVFAATELILYEDLGFCEKGQGASFLKEGRTTVGGDVLINASGGRISMGHPAGATPLYEVTEIVQQLRGEAKGIQAPDPKVGLVHAEHGMMNGSIVMILERN